MQKDIEIPTQDGHIIYGTLNRAEKSKGTLLILAHGLSGNQYEHHYLNCSPFFTQKGFDTFRFDLYSREDRGRQLSECSLTTHVEDLELVISYFKDKYDKLVLIGHSVGSLVILKADLSDIDRIILWDPTAGFKKIEDKQGYYEPRLNKYVLNWGLNLIVDKKLIEEWQAVDLDELVKKIKVPCKFIFAGGCNKYEMWQPYLDKIGAEYEIVTVKGADHGFTEEGTEEKLFNATLSWLK